MGLLFIALLAGLGAWFHNHQAVIVPEPPRERIVLLPNADGRPSAVVIKSAKGESVIDKPYLAANLDRAGAITAFQEEADVIKARYDSTLTALPQRAGGYVIYFNAGSDTVSPESSVALDKMRAELAKRSHPEITIVGHSDRVDTDENSDNLASRRALAIRRLLLDSGLEAERIAIEEKGDRDPQTATPDDQRNRRAEIRVR